MNLHVNQEELRQKQHYGNVRARLMNPKNAVKPMVALKTVDDHGDEFDAKGLVSLLRSRLYEAEKQLQVKREIIAKLELDLSDAHARILTQASQIFAQREEEEELTAESVRKPVKQIIAEVLSEFPHVTWEEVKSIRRTRRLIEPRQTCMYEIYTQRPDLSFPSIGRLFGNRDHTTILHAVNKVRAAKEQA